MTCDSQVIFGKKRCLGCQYFDSDWSLPDLNTSHAEKKLTLDEIRKVFRDAKDWE